MRTRNYLVSAILALLLAAGCAQQKKTEQTAAISAASPEAVVAQGEVSPAAVPEDPAQVASSPAPLPPGSIGVDEAFFCTGVKDRRPQEISDVFDSSVGKVFFFTRVKGAKQPTSVTHVWYWNEKKVAEVPLDVRSENWRTWSSKKIDPAWTGQWAVKVLDQNGDLVVAKNFEVR